MTPLQAHLICAALVAADLLARAWRIQWLVQGLGHRMSLWDSFVLNAFGDAACALTPLRIGGEPARLAGMLRSRVPAPAAFVAISLEVLAAWPVIIVAAGWLAWRYAPEWWSAAGPRLSAAAATAWPWVLAVAVVSLLAWRARAAGRVAGGAPAPAADSSGDGLLAADAALAAGGERADELHQPGDPSRDPSGARADPARSARDGPARRRARSPCSTASSCCPRRRGAGAVELGFLGGAAGDLGSGEGWLLLAWRFYTNGIGRASSA